MKKAYKIYFDYGGVMLWDQNGAIDCSEAPVSHVMRVQMQVLSDMVNAAMVKVDETNEKPSNEDKLLFRQMYNDIVSKIKTEISQNGEIISETYPWVFE